MRYHFVAAALVVGLASPAFAQSRTLPAGSEAAFQQPVIDGSADGARLWHAPRVLEGRSIAVDRRAGALRPANSDDLN